MQSKLETRLISSLEKVFADEDLRANSWQRGTMLTNEVYSFQAAYRWGQFIQKGIVVRVISPLSSCITLRKVQLIPSEMPCYADHDDNILRTQPGLYPDLLKPLDEDGLVLLPGQWRSLWVTVDPKSRFEAGSYPIELVFETAEGEELAREGFELEMLGNVLPEQTLIHTAWFHGDCLSTWYGDEVFSEAHWKRIEQYIDAAVRYGINMILTPVFTPPLDTQVGKERPTVQLVEVEKVGTAYKFRFDKLKRWVKICQDNGVRYFEFSHLFTQWGARHAPKIMAVEEGVLKQIFGWETDAAGEAYGSFLDQMLPSLIDFIREEGLQDCSYFHVSDEPHLDHLASYKIAADRISRHLSDFPIIDALSNYDFYQNGLIKIPIPATDHIDTFLEHEVPNLWAYYCCSQYRKVANRFFNMPAARNRILGIQLYKFNIVGFLHWGYNFWYSRHSRFPINPYVVTDADHSFPSGDAFVVYPDETGPLVSMRLEVFYEALQDMRALQLLESLVGRDAVMDLLEGDLEKPITFSEYPQDAAWLLKMREKINRRIKVAAVR